LEIGIEEVNFFWLGKLYFALPLPKEWKEISTFGKKKSLIYNDFVCKLRPSIGYVYYLIQSFKSNNILK